MRPSFQSPLACSIRSFLDHTKFPQINLCPGGSPPISIRVVFSFAIITGSAPLAKTSICPVV